MNHDLEKFVAELMVEKSVPADLDPAVVTQMKHDLYTRVEDRLMAGILARMTKEQLTAYEELLDGNTAPAEMQAFLDREITNLPAVIAAELADFKLSYLNG